MSFGERPPTEDVMHEAKENLIPFPTIDHRAREKFLREFLRVPRSAMLFFLFLLAKPRINFTRFFIYRSEHSVYKLAGGFPAKRLCELNRLIDGDARRDLALVGVEELKEA